MNKLYALFFYTLIGHAAGAQSLYEFEYYFEEPTGREYYKAFLVRNDDGTGFVRVRFFNPEEKQFNIVEMQLDEHYHTEKNGYVDTTVLVMQTYDPVIKTGDKKNGYDPDDFWFKKSEGIDFFEPWAVMSSDDEATAHQGVISNVKLLEGNDLTKNLVSQYFNGEEPFFKNLFEPAVVRGPAAGRGTLPGSAKLYLILVANTNDASIGATCVIDKDATLKTFQQIAEYLNIPFEPQVIYGKYYSKVNVDNAIKTLAPGPNDIVVFYYSGHGYAYNGDAYTFPYLDLRTKDFQPLNSSYSLNMQDVYRAIKSKGARLNLVLSDCCNADPALSNRTSTGTASMRSSSLGWSLQNCQQLFLNEKPVSILMTAASKGELSAGNNSNGGFFTFNFRESLEKRIGLFSQFVSWNDLVAAAKQQTIKKASNTLCPNISGDGFSVCKQTPVFIIE